jgi:hypothetical protein
MNILHRVSGHFNGRDYYHNALITLDASSVAVLRGWQIVLAARISSWCLLGTPARSWRPSTLTQRSNLLIKSRASSFTDQIRADGYRCAAVLFRPPQLGGRCNLCGPLPTAPLANASAARWQIFDISRQAPRRHVHAAPGISAYQQVLCALHPAASASLSPRHLPTRLR